MQQNVLNKLLGLEQKLPLNKKPIRQPVLSMANTTHKECSRTLAYHYRPS